MGGVTAKIKQIGNSVPSVAAKVLYESIRKELDKEDGVTARPIVIDEERDDVIVLDEERDDVILLDEEEGFNAGRPPPVPRFRVPNYNEKEVIVLDEEDYVVVPARVAHFPVQPPFGRRHGLPVVTHNKKASNSVMPEPRVAQFPVRSPFGRRNEPPVGSHRKASIIVIDDDEIENSIVDVRKRVELVDIASDDESDVFYDCFSTFGGRD